MAEVQLTMFCLQNVLKQLLDVHNLGKLKNFIIECAQLTFTLSMKNIWLIIPPRKGIIPTFKYKLSYYQYSIHCCWDVSIHKDTCLHGWVPEFWTQSYKFEGENQHFQVVFRPPHKCYDICMLPFPTGNKTRVGIIWKIFSLR